MQLSASEANWIMWIWAALILPWLVIAPLSGMAFDADEITGWLFVAHVWSYPLIVMLAFWLKRRNPAFVWLPAANFVLPFAIAYILDGLHVKG
jgi:hypothetical protein